MPYFLLILGLAILVLAGDFLVRGAVGLSHRMGLPTLVIGLTVVAFGTSVPELVVSISAAIEGAPGLSIGNVVGSNITNILLVLGAPALIFAIRCGQPGLWRSATFMVMISALLILLSLDETIGFIDGLVLIGLLAAYLIYNFVAASMARRRNQTGTGLVEEIGDAPTGIGKIVVFLAIGIFCLPLGGKLITDGALDIAEIIGVADSAIGLSIIALGTSLPELATGVAAALRKHPAMAIGNAIGSNIFNILSILGITSLIIPLNVDDNFLHFDYWVLLAVSVCLLPIVFMQRSIGRYAGLVMVLLYAGYMILVFDIGHQMFPGGS